MAAKVKVATIPLVGVPTQRGIYPATALAAGKDQRYIAVFFQSLDNPQTNTKNIYAEKRNGWETSSTPAAGAKGNSIFRSSGLGANLSIFGSTPTWTIYKDSTSVGTLSVTPSGIISDAFLNGEYVGLFVTSGELYYLPAGAGTGGTFVGDTHTNTTIDNIVSITGLYVGQLLSGTGIAANTRIQSIDSATAITTTVATTATNAGVTITRTGLSKVIDADFPSDAVGKAVEFNGYIFVATNSNKIYNCASNNVASWAASDYLTSYINATVSTIERYGNYIVAFGRNGVEFFVFAGNSSGSLLSHANININIGGINATGVSSLGNTVAFVGSPNGQDFGVYILDGNDARKISTPIIDGLLTSSTYLDGFTYLGKRLISIHDGTASADPTFSYLYDFETGIWAETAFTESYRITGNAAGGVFSVSMDNTAGKIYILSRTTPTFTDDGAAYTMTIQTEPWDGGTQDWKQVIKYELIGDTQASGTTTLAVSDDDYATFTTLGTFDMTQPRKELYNGTWFQGSRAHQLTHSANTGWRAQALRITYRVGEM